MQKRVYARVSGWVQGVGFRYFVKYTASLHGLTGWVHNREDGDVELEVQGPPAELDAFLEAVQEGNRWSQVEGVETRRLDPIRENGFEVL
ncbi:acylphosphatase [bacterium 210820-DFI.6.52]|nr:acylphosphatase [bacterium 210820-DFI.6.52]